MSSIHISQAKTVTTILIIFTGHTHTSKELPGKQQHYLHRHYNEHVTGPVMATHTHPGFPHFFTPLLPKCRGVLVTTLFFFSYFSVGSLMITVHYHSSFQHGTFVFLRELFVIHVLVIFFLFFFTFLFQLFNLTRALGHRLYRTNQTLHITKCIHSIFSSITPLAKKKNPVRIFCAVRVAHFQLRAIFRTQKKNVSSQGHFSCTHFFLSE